MMKFITFIVPDVNSFISGGNLYNQRLVEALENLPDVSISYLKLEEVPLNLVPLNKGIFFVDSLYVEAFATRLLTRKSGQVFYLLVHHLSSMYKEPTKETIEQSNLQEERLLISYDGFLVTSTFTERYLREKGIQQPIIVLPPIPSILVPIPTTRNLSPIQVIIVANLLPRKGILPFLKQLTKHSKRDLKNIIITIIGESTLNPLYAASCLQLLSDNSWLGDLCQFKGALTPSEVQKAYQQANLMISVSAFETFGMALQEAVVFGLPILAVKGGNIENHIKEEVNGWVFDSIASLVDQLILLSDSPQEMKQLSMGAFAHKKEQPTISWSTHAKELIQNL